jgi:leader peptidase (prepilin peptidase) / N-methyltransferase
MRDVSIISCGEARRCRRLGLDAGEILLARKGAQAHSHVLWLGLVGFVYLLAQFDELGWYIVPSVALFASLAAIVLFDARYFLIPDKPILFLFFSGALTVLASSSSEIPARLAAATCAWGLLRLVALAYERWRGLPGLGLGDAKLFGIAGLWLGFPGLPGCLLVAALSGLVSAAILIRDHGWVHARQPIPFGPHLALGLWLSWAMGPIESGSILN